MAKKKAPVVIAPEPWEMQPEETSKAFEAFAIYRDLGPGRSIAKVGKELGKNCVTLEEWSTKYDWVKRAAAWDAEVDRVARQEQLNAIKKMRVRHAKLASDLLDKVEKEIETLQPGAMTPNEIARITEVATKLERISRGDVGDVIEERDGGEAASPVQIYIPDNNRGKDKDTFDDLEVE